MYLRSLLLSASLLCLIHGGRAEPQYVISVPAMLKSGHTEMMCLNIEDIEGTLDLNVVLQYKEDNSTIFAEQVSVINYFQCNKFKVPEVKEAEPVSITFSAVGESIKLQERRTVVINPMRDLFKFQMDKPLYKPGHNVQFRLISMSPELKPLKAKYPVIYMKDPSGSRFAQWLDMETHNGIVSLNHQLISDATPGSYSITAERESGSAISQSFTVEEYVLPRYTIDVKSPSTLSVMDEFVNFSVSARYTYDQPIPGSVSGRWCRKPSYHYGRRSNCNKNKEGICFDIKGKLDANGTYQGVLDLKLFFMELSGFQTNLDLDLTVTEDGSGTQVRKRSSIWISSELANIRFESMNQNYKRGMPYTVTVKLTDQNDNPMTQEMIELEIDGKKILNLKTNAEGKAQYEIDTSTYFSSNFTVKASYMNPDQCYYSSWRESPDYPTIEYTVQSFYSQSGSFVDVRAPKGELGCGQSHKIEVRYILNKEELKMKKNKPTFYYQVMSRSMIVHSGKHKVNCTNAKSNSFFIDLAVTPDFAPGCDLIVYCILQKEVIVDTVQLNIEKCFNNQVSMSFSQEQGAPGSSVDLVFSAAPQSLCAFRVIDYSLLILKSYDPFSADSIYNSIPYRSLYGYYVGGLDLEDPPPPCVDPDKQIFYNGNYYLPVSSKNEGDSYKKLKRIGLMFVTAAITRKSEVCEKEEREFDYMPAPRSTPHLAYSGAKMASVEMSDMVMADAPTGMSAKSAKSAVSAESTVETVRKNFADNWFWGTSAVDSRGDGAIPLTVPDTITEWKGSGFCVSHQEGFGMTRYLVNFTSFLPFFVELSMPYSIIRGETLELRASVPNYLKHSIKVTVKLEKSPDFDAKLLNGKLDICILSGEKAYYTWNVVAKKIGEVSFKVSAATYHIGVSCDGPNDPSQPPRKDTVIQSIIVEAEGIRKEETTSNLICLKDTTSETQIRVTTPANVVPGSVQAFILALGDPIGLPLQNLQNLLQLPYGCAEQNMARMAPILYVLEYLNNTGQLTDEILEKGKRFLTEAYVRQLGFRLRSGTYGVFGRTATKGNSWLTAYTYKTFEKARNLIYIDLDVQKQSLIWLEKSQKLESGCFKPTGNLFMMRGDSEDDISFTAYLSISLLESQYAITKPLLTGSMRCLVDASMSQQSLYNRALMLYSFTLNENWERRSSLLEELKREAISKDGTVHWENAWRPEIADFRFFPYKTDAVEITSYILLSLLKGPRVTRDDLSYMAQIALWITRQQNSQGGFRSTQDTVVALQALSAYAQRVYTPNTQHRVAVRSHKKAVKSGSKDISKFSLNKDNRLLVQRQPLPDVPGDYSIGVTGVGCCLVQTTVRYNVPVPKDNSAFSLSIYSSSESCVNGVAYTFTLNISISYQGNRTQPNMVIVEIKMLSGHSADYWSLRELVQSKRVSKTEQQNGRVFLYMETVSRDTTYLSFKVQMGNRVLNVKEASAKCYDYYETEENAAATYSHPCASQA